MVKSQLSGPAPLSPQFPSIIISPPTEEEKLFVVILILTISTPAVVGVP